MFVAFVGSPPDPLGGPGGGGGGGRREFGGCTGPSSGMIIGLENAVAAETVAVLPNVCTVWNDAILTVEVSDGGRGARWL